MDKRVGNERTGQNESGRENHEKGCHIAAQNLAVTYSELDKPRLCMAWLRKACQHEESADWLLLKIFCLSLSCLVAKHVSILWKNPGNRFPLSGKMPKHASILWKMWRRGGLPTRCADSHPLAAKLEN